MDISELVNLTSRAWSLTILSLLHEGVAGRQAPLCAASGASRTAFGQSLNHLIEIGLLERNPGHGHPLRPEFRLTARGVKAAEMAHRVLKAAEAEGSALLRKTWTLPVLASLRKPLYFNDIKRQLPAITDRALSISLSSMEGNDWVQRVVHDDVRPPRSLYRATNVGGEISLIAAAATTFRPHALSS